MRRALVATLFGSVLAIPLACSNATAPLADEPLPEAGTDDDTGAQTTFDGGGTRDTGARQDASSGGDAGSDATTDGALGDAAGDGPLGDGALDFTLNGCNANPNNYQDEKGGGDSREITFNNNGNYNNRCMRIRVNQSVTWKMQGGNTFANHPLVQKGGSPGNPIPSTPVNIGTAYSVTFTQTGLFGFGCATHTTITNESGAVYVVP